WQQRVPRVAVGGSQGGRGLSPQSEHFKTTSQRVARRYWWKNVKLLIILGLVGAIILILIILLATGTIPT
uniref:V-SNARE coiled-coil homology domain-containing protein n=1 Tax=Bubo bubo TaxID=30461 RepID=A0A8C0EMX3_BUBBB